MQIRFDLSKLFQINMIIIFFFYNADLYALQISICCNNFRVEPESNPSVSGTGLSNRARMTTIFKKKNYVSGFEGD